MPIREWARKSAFLAIFLLLSALGTRAAQEYEEMQSLYRQYMGTPSERLYKTGHEFLEQEKFDEAMVCFTIVGNRYSPKMSTDEKRLCAYALNNAGGISQLRSSYSTAFSYYKKAMQVADEPIHQTYNNIAGIYLFYNDFENARRYLTQAFDVSMEQKNWESVSNALQNIIFLNWSLDSLGATALQAERYRTADSLPHDLRYHYTLRMADGTLAAARGDYRQAISLFQQNITLTDSAQQVVTESYNAPLYIAMAYKALADYPMALHYLKDVEQETRQSGAVYMLMLVYKLQTECYRLMGNAQAARQSNYEYMNLKDSINTAEELGKIKNIEFFDEVDRYEKQVVQLNEEKNRRSQVAIVSIVGMLVVGLLLAFAIRQNKQLYESNKDLFRKNDELVHQADTEKLQRAAFNKKISGFIDEIAALHATIDTLRKTFPAPSDEPAAACGDDDAAAQSASGREFTEDQRTAIMEKVYQQLDDVSFLSQPDLTVERLAQAIGVHDRYVSQAINETMNKNFNTLLNEYRIREACKRLTDTEHYGLMTNETIAEGLGYKSRSHFTRTFKKITGLTPSQYQKMAKEG